MDEPHIQGWQGIMVYVGLGTPAARAFVAGTAVGIAAYLAKQPSACFKEGGEMRPMALVSTDPQATYYHFLAVPLTAATVAYLFT